jgi:putative methionine-R-sulfoxide reductase with GAF domain
VTKDPRYIAAVPGVRSELVVPLLWDRCIGVFDLESPEPMRSTRSTSSC